MERIHSGEDKGRGVKAWNPKEKDNFKVRRSNKKSLAYLVDFYIKKYCNGFEITSIMSFTTIQRIFGNKVVKEILGLDINDETSFSRDRMKTIVNVSKMIIDESKNEGVSVTRLYNKSTEIVKKVVPMINNNQKGDDIVKKLINGDDSSDEPLILIENNEQDGVTGNRKKDDNIGETSPIDKEIANGITKCRGSQKNLPYFFEGIDFSKLDSSDSKSHGVAQVCKELKFFSENELVEELPIASAFMVRNIIEQSIIYYSKTHLIQGQERCIWNNIKDCKQLSKIVDNYNKNLTNYIPDKIMRNYFTDLFGNYNASINPLNWVVHNPFDYQIEPSKLIMLPKQGLLALINYLIGSGM